MKRSRSCLGVTWIFIQCETVQVLLNGDILLKVEVVFRLPIEDEVIFQMEVNHGKELEEVA